MGFELIKFTNCKILRNHKIITEDIWVRNGKIMNPEMIFFDEKIHADTVINCNGNFIAPGFIELQINGEYKNTVCRMEIRLKCGIIIMFRNVYFS